MGSANYQIQEPLILTLFLLVGSPDGHLSEQLDPDAAANLGEANPVRGCSSQLGNIASAVDIHCDSAVA